MGDVPLWPTVNAGLNAVAAVLLVAGFVAIRRGSRGAHKTCMIGAFSVSAAFLASYIGYHTARQGAVTGFPEGVGGRGAYLVLLLSHTIGAAVALLLEIATMWQAVRGNFSRHRKVARVTLPLWIYVAASGVSVYLWLYIIAGATPATPWG